MTGVAVDDMCVEKYNQIKMKKDLRYVIFKIEDKKKITFDQEGESSATYSDFTAKLPEKEPRYALVDIDYTSEDGRPQSKLCFVFWSPDSSGVKEKMIYAGSKDAVKKKFTGIMKEIQANDPGDLEESEVHKLMKS
mmetsp:Transcript_67806/g.219089  ORF Transcript_67806/g.219089 Transcript_67806/m.219089 type:complete len:136 (+) Transcript_67806:57-464(+)